MDTGASRTVMANRVFQRVKAHYPELETFKSASPLEQADGDKLMDHGSCIVKLKVGDLVFKQNVYISDIKDDILLGMDVGIFDVLTSESVVKIDGNTIPCTVVKSEGPRVVASAEVYRIPGFSEMIIDVNSNHLLDLSPDQLSQLVIEPSLNFVEGNSIVAGHSLVDTSSHQLGHIWVINPNSDEVCINKGTVIGSVEPSDSHTILFSTTDMEHADYITDMTTTSSPTDTNLIRHISDDDLNPQDKLKQLENQLPCHLQKVFVDASSGRDISEQIQIVQLLIEYQDSFSKNDTDLGCTHLTEHTIDTGDSKPFRVPPRRLPLALADEEQKAIDQLKEQGSIQESNSPWASPIVLVRKKTGKIRLCVDYRKLNQQTRKDAYPLPRTQDCLDAMAGSTIFSTLDMTAGYNQVPVKPEDIPKTAFVTKHGLYEFRTMPFGLTNEPATFQRVMELALQGLQWTSCLIYLDDVIIFGATFEQHQQRLRQILSRVKLAKMKLKPEKCELCQAEVTFLGHVVSKEGILPNPSLVDKIKQWPPPQNVTEVRQFLGLASYYRRFIKNFSIIARPLSDLTRKDTKLEWTSTCQTAFEELKGHLIGPEIMAYPCESGEYILDTDACNFGIGAVLSQVQNGKPRVIAYASRSLSKSERNYCVTDKVLLAVVYFVQYFRYYILGRKFLVRSDHQALRWLFSLREPKGRVSRWIEILSAYNFEIEYRPGKQHGNADGMSRCPNPRECTCSEQEVDLKCGPCNKCVKRATDMQHSETLRRIPTQTTPPPVDTSSDSTWFTGHTTRELRHLQSSDPAIGALLRWKQQHKRPYGTEICSNSPETRHYWNYWNSIEIHGDLLFKRNHSGDGGSGKLQFVVPQKMRNTVLRQMHDSVIGAHLGRRKTTSKVLQNCYWFQLRDDVHNWLACCDICAANKSPTKKPRAPLGDMRVGAPMDRWAWDIIGPLPVTSRGNRYILVVTDAFSKWVEAFALEDQTAETCAKCLVKEMISRYGYPLDLLSDQGRNFESQIFAELCQLLGIRKIRTSPRHPQSNGQVERFKKTLIPMIRPYLQGEQTNWDINLHLLTSAYRSTRHESTRYTPNMLMFRREVRLPGEIITESPTPIPEEQKYGLFLQGQKDKMCKVHMLVREHLGHPSTNSTRQL